MRKINTGDVFKLARIIKTTEVKEDIINIYTDSKKMKEETAEVATPEQMKEQAEAVQEKIGVKIFFTIFEKCTDVKTEKLIYELIGGIAEKKPAEIENMPLDEMLELLSKIVKENNIRNFFNTALNLEEKMPD